jgi:hypothetical protein
MLSVWSSSCVCAMLLAFLACSYMRDISDRRRYLKHLQVVQLRSDLDQMRESMIPSSLSAAVDAGEVVLASPNNI